MDLDIEAQISPNCPRFKTLRFDELKEILFSFNVEYISEVFLQ